MHTSPIEAWHRIVSERDARGLDTLLADGVVFHSPVLHTPQVGREVTQRYLTAALHVLGNPTFTYVREVVGARDAVLEFVTEIDGITVNGVDLITWNDAGQIIDFKVMVRPLKAMQIVQQRMAAMLQGAVSPAARTAAAVDAADSRL